MQNKRPNKKQGHKSPRGGKPAYHGKDRAKDGAKGGKPPYKGRPGASQDRPARPKEKPKGRASLWGVHAVNEAWVNPKREIKALYVTESALKSFEPTLYKAKGLKRPEPTIVERRDLDRMLGEDTVHQGIALDALPLEEVFVQDIVAMSAEQEKTVLLMLDQVTDPHNVGAILRSACVFGAAGVIMQRRHSPELNGILVKTASGAAEHIPVAYEINLSDTLDFLRGEGFYAVGLDERGEIDISGLPKGGKTVLVLGAEGKGLRPKVREHCDTLARLPTAGPISSLNVSNAAAVSLYAVCQEPPFS